MTGVEAVYGKADIDVLELIRLWLPILVDGFPIAIVKVVNKVRSSYEIGAFDGEISLIEQHIDYLVNLGKIRAKILVVLQLYNGIGSIGIIVEAPSTSKLPSTKIFDASSFTIATRSCI